MNCFIRGIHSARKSDREALAGAAVRGRSLGGREGCAMTHSCGLVRSRCARCRDEGCCPPGAYAQRSREDEPIARSGRCRLPIPDPSRVRSGRRGRPCEWSASRARASDGRVLWSARAPVSVRPGPGAGASVVHREATGAPCALTTASRLAASGRGRAVSRRPPPRGAGRRDSTRSRRCPAPRT